jgi:membrane-associated phospholipid phosphatase
MGSLAVVATLVIVLWATRWRWLALGVGGAFVLLVGLSRLYLGSHYPSDILAGWCASLAWVLGVYQLRILPLPRQFPSRIAAWRSLTGQ